MPMRSANSSCVISKPHLLRKEGFRRTSR